MRAGGQHGVRPTAEALLIGEMKLRRGGSEPVKIASDVIQRDEAVVTVKGGVFQPFGHHRAGELLEFHGEGCHGVSVRGILSFRDASQKHFTDEIEDAGIGGRTSPFGRGDGAADVAYVVIRNAGGADVGAVHGKAGDHFRQCIAQAVEGEVASAPFGESDPGDLIGKYVQFTGQGNPDDQFSAAVGEVVKIDVSSSTKFR